MNALAVLLDIEGTTTPISFVHRVLFPYAAAQAQRFLDENRHDAAVKEAVRAILEDATAEERERGREDALAGALAVVRRQMAADVKATGLKALQGLIWKAGYAEGVLRGEVYDDVPAAFTRLRAEARPIAIYSSGSKLAQQLLFRHSTAGDLTPFLDGYYDTTTGPKREADSYAAIARAWQRSPDSILFCTDILAECDAALAAGMQAVLLMRPGNPPLPANLPCPVHADLSRI